MRRNILDFIRPAVTTLNDDEVHLSEDELQWFTHTKAYEKWKKSGTGMIWYRADSNCLDDSRKGVAAAVAYHSSEKYASFAGPQFGLGDAMAKSLYFQCDRRQAGDDFDLDAPDCVYPEDLLWSLICQCLIMDCKTVSSVNRRILEWDEYSKAVLQDALIGRTTQPIAVVFDILFQALQFVGPKTMLALDNIHLLEDTTGGAFIDALQVFIERRLPQAERSLPTVITSSTTGTIYKHLADVPSVDDETEREGNRALYK
jgi:hypothetical protein